MIKLKNLIFEIADLPPPESAEVRFVPHSNSIEKNKDVYINKDVNFSNNKPKQSESNQNPTFEEYKNHFIKYEGKKNNTYIDSRGFPTVGIGHKFEKGEKRKSKYTDSEIDEFFKKDLEDAIKISKKTFPNFESLPKNVKIHLVSLSFNLGEGGISKFVNFRSAIQNKNWKKAADELKNSKWYSQVGNRAKDYVKHFNDLV